MAASRPADMAGILPPGLLFPTLDREDPLYAALGERVNAAER